MARTIQELERSATSYLGSRDVFDSRMDIAEEFRLGRKLRAPIRCALEESSSFLFVGDLERSLAKNLVDLGLKESLAPAMIWEVLAEPSVALAAEEHGNHKFRQAVVIARDGNSSPFDLRLVVDAVIVPRGHDARQQRTPPAIVSVAVSIDMYDLDEEPETARLVRELLDWCLEFPAPLSERRSRPQPMAFVGDPRRIGIEEVPDSWRQYLTILAAMFMLTAEVKDGPSFDGTLSSKTTLVVKLDPYAGKTLVVPSDTGIVLIDARGRTFMSVVDEISIHLVTREAALVDIQNATAARDLLPGERVYHRKIGSSRNFDRFNEGSPKPCSHGESSFIPWHGPKATKGLERRYTNFEPGMHKHCSRYPTCGMYAVFA
ncbi:hypothetical protein E3O55_18935 [Cryobacterium sp. MDB1-18-2]|uniref:hypothetical protein n=1 Tax=unclassified Cryobacterium TaxID=2649013 RepID=UPI00106CCDF5|nr:MULTISPECIES: hypothetical protein [unclassified Cryobacterium]TFC22094.1 hypothetical protein E3O55_18935 [Cryobacterium sp. MDB1-18-2]TFC40667.1 hypothetical protein E3O50_12730 [Cryobacterium sp. MDB1-18-1]